MSLEEGAYGRSHNWMYSSPRSVKLNRNKLYAQKFVQEKINLNIKNCRQNV